MCCSNLLRSHAGELVPRPGGASGLRIGGGTPTGGQARRRQRQWAQGQRWDMYMSPSACRTRVRMVSLLHCACAPCLRNLFESQKSNVLSIKRAASPARQGLYSQFETQYCEPLHLGERRPGNTDNPPTSQVCSRGKQPPPARADWPRVEGHGCHCARRCAGAGGWVPGWAPVRLPPACRCATAGRESTRTTVMKYPPLPAATFKPPGV